MTPKVSTAVRKGHVEGLRAMRDSLASAMDAAEPAVVAQIAARLQAVLKELAELEPAKETTLDEITKRRAARLSGANAPAPAERPARQRSR